MLILKVLGILVFTSAYLAGLWQWIYREKMLSGLGAVLLCFPAIIWFTLYSPFMYLRALPVVGIAMFFHRYRARILMQVKLLWFTTLSVAVVQGYLLVAGYMLARK